MVRDCTRWPKDMILAIGVENESKSDIERVQNLSRIKWNTKRKYGWGR